MPTVDHEFSLTNPPPEGHPDVGLFAYALFEMAAQEKERLGLPERWYENHRLYRGDHWNRNRRLSKNRAHEVTANLLFANIQRTVANLTARDPVAEVHSVDGIEDDADMLLSQRIKNWWNNDEQGNVLARSALQMETYGITIEKFVPNPDAGNLDVVVKDPYSWFPAPGVYDDIQDMPYMCDAYPMDVSDVEAMFGVEGVVADDTYSLLGEDREDNIPQPAGIRTGISGAKTTDHKGSIHTLQALRQVREPRALVIEVWLRDLTMEPVTVETPDGPQESEQLKYPGGIRKITLTNRGHLVLDDSPNPNVNPALDRSLGEHTYAWGHYPYAKACSYEDTTSIWGFAAAEQVGDLQAKINEILSRIAAYVSLCCMPPLVLPMDTGVSDAKITNQAGLIIRPTSTMASQGIRYLQVPNLPTNFFQALDIHLNFFDRIFAIQDVDRGETPRNIEAASAIITLQERNAVLMRHKIRATDYLVRERGRWAISFFQNFGWQEELLDVQDEMRLFRGTDYAGRKFNYVVESGSTITKTNLQVMQDAKELYQMGVIDRQALLESVNFPNWKQILERTAEGQLNQALQVLIEAGLPQEDAQYLHDWLMQAQGGPGNRRQTPPMDAPGNPPIANNGGTPRAMQGQIPSAEEMANVPVI